MAVMSDEGKYYEQVRLQFRYLCTALGIGKPFVRVNHCDPGYWEIVESDDEQDWTTTAFFEESEVIELRQTLKGRIAVPVKTLEVYIYVPTRGTRDEPPDEEAVFVGETRRLDLWEACRIFIETNVKLRLDGVSEHLGYFKMQLEETKDEDLSLKA